MASGSDQPRGSRAHSVSKPSGRRSLRNFAEEVAPIAASRYIANDDEQVAEWRRDAQEQLGRRAAERLQNEEAASYAYIKSLQARDRSLDAEDVASLQLAEQLEVQERLDREMAQSLQLIEKERREEEAAVRRRKEAEEEATRRFLAQQGIQQAPPVDAMPSRPSAASASANSKWNCEFCTFENKHGGRVCSMCSKSRAIPDALQRSNSMPAQLGPRQSGSGHQPTVYRQASVQPCQSQQYVVQAQGCPRDPRPVQEIYVTGSHLPRSGTTTIYLPAQSCPRDNVYVVRRY